MQNPLFVLLNKFTFVLLVSAEQQSSVCPGAAEILQTLFGSEVKTRSVFSVFCQVSEILQRCRTQDLLLMVCHTLKTQGFI